MFKNIRFLYPTGYKNSDCAEGAYFDPVKVEVQPKVLLKPIGLS